MRVGCISLVLCGCAALASAQDLPDSLRACARESDGVRRLACYDKEMAAVAQTKPAKDKTASATGELAPADEIGLSQEQVKKLKAKKGMAEAAPPPKELRAHIAAVTQLPYNRQRITLDNNQVWDQAEDDWGFRAQSGDAVTITSGLLGGFWMATDPRKKVRVVRVR
jgi:hypothetical protein